MSHNRPELKFNYLYADNYNPSYINGAHGGLTSRGELVVNFYLERPGLPEAITHEINPNGTLGPEIVQDHKDGRNSLVRFISSGIILNFESAILIHAWLGDRIKEMESMERAKAAAQFVQTSSSNDVTH